jgi:hypothetical protein
VKFGLTRAQYPLYPEIYSCYAFSVIGAINCTLHKSKKNVGWVKPNKIKQKNKIKNGWTPHPNLPHKGKEFVG